MEAEIKTTEVSESEISDLEAMAKLITDNKVFDQFIHAIAPHNRLTAYNQLTPYLSFKPKPYWWLMARSK